ncbi:type VI secretion system Vgr family protein [Vibrio salinus]|uniref:type VI secretion system Vgr family protein n=1 Tax=Vibrio salinus TaxID=2899784 RepID=UPI001E32FBCE|nr:type VI secretion system tip protein VgrG [Vibrio salinus]MCE0495147.1 type VI secretion system tip protein VgrG [Vibrio salinus]
MATLGFQITIDGLDDDTLVVREYQGHESISDSVDWAGRPCFGYRYQIELASRRMDLTADDIVDSKALLQIVRNGEVVQKVHGIVRSFSKGDTGHHHTFYSITVVPSLERLSLRHNSRIFQQQSVPEILSVLLQEMNITDYTYALKNEYAKREFCVQYRESDLDFFHRLAAEEGLVYSFIHKDDRHILFFTDSSESLPDIGEGVPYNVLSGGTTDTPYVSQMDEHRQSEPDRIAMQDYSFKKPAYHFAQSAQGSDMEYQLHTYEHFDAPGRFKDDAQGKLINQVRLEYLRRNAHTATGKSNQSHLKAGSTFVLTDHINAEMNRDWLLVAVAHQGTQPQALEEMGGHGATTYANQFTVIPANITWRATPQPKPRVDGPMIALVVGPDKEEIYCDEYGRVKLQFPWDRYGNGDDQSSCWVRVSQGWAGAQYGMMMIPRIGHEVIVSFLNGDPDQPIVTGRTYHAQNTPPYTLPDNKTKTVIRTESHQGKGFNELSFEDQSGSEKIYIHAQKDIESLVENDATRHIKHDRHLTVDNDRYSNVKVNDHLTIDGEQRIKIANNCSLNVGQSLQQKVGKKTALQAGQEVHLKASNKIVLQAGNEVTLKGGSGIIKLDAAGAHVIGPKIGLNSGGSAGSGSGYAGKVAELPTTLEALKAPDELVQDEVTASLVSAAATLKSAEPVVFQQVQYDLAQGTPITQLCQKRSDGTCPLSDCPCGNNV